MDVSSGGGCLGRCGQHRGVVRGSGIIDYVDLGGEPRDAPRRRTIDAAQIISLLNEFLEARFLDARDAYRERPLVVRREGSRSGSVRRVPLMCPPTRCRCALVPLLRPCVLYWGNPKDLERLRDVVERLGGPSAWVTQ